MTPIIAVANHKGGSGKTTTAYHLAWHLAEMKLNVLAVDLDDQGGLTSRMYSRSDRHYNLTVADVLLREATVLDARATGTHSSMPHLLPADTRLAWAAAKLQAMSPNHMFLARALAKTTDYDVIVLDCPPSADIVIVNALMAATCVVMAATPTIESYDGTLRMRAMVGDLGEMTGRQPELLGIVATQVVTMSKSHQRYLEQMGGSVIGCVPLRVGVDAHRQLGELYRPIAERIWTEVRNAA